MPSTTFDPPRDLTFDERAILDFLIEANTEHRDFLRRLLHNSKVTGLCQCGCGSPNLTADESVFRERPPSMPLKLEKDATAKVEGVAVVVLLFVSDDEPKASLEFVWSTRDFPSRLPRTFPSRLPRPDELQVARWEPDPR